jgi:hypothetical protein
VLPKLAPWLSAGVILALAAAAWLGREPPPAPRSPGTSVVEKGAACDELELALSAAGKSPDRGEVVRALNLARKEAIRALANGGVRFGPPERAALKIAALVEDRPIDIDRSLRRRIRTAVTECEA